MATSQNIYWKLKKLQQVRGLAVDMLGRMDEKREINKKEVKFKHRQTRKEGDWEDDQEGWDGGRTTSRRISERWGGGGGLRK